MPGYIDKSLHKFHHSSPLCKNNSPHQCRIPQYGARIKYVKDEDITSELDKDEKKKYSRLLEQCYAMLGLYTVPCS